MSYSVFPYVKSGGTFNIPAVNYILEAENREVLRPEWQDREKKRPVYSCGGVGDYFPGLCLRREVVIPGTGGYRDRLYPGSKTACCKPYTF